MIQTISAMIILGLILYTQWKKLRWRRGKRTVTTEQVTESQLPVCACNEEATPEIKSPVEKPGK